MSAAFTGADGKLQIPGRGTDSRYPARGERSVLNGKPVVADGKGNWLDGSKPMTPMSERNTVGNYNPGLRFPSVKQIKGDEYVTTPQNTPDNGLIDFGVGGKRIVAPKNGVMGYMIPGKPDTWVADGDKIGISGETREKAKARYEKTTGKTLTSPKSDPPKTVPPQSEAPVETQTSSSSTSQSSARVNANGLVSYGKDLSSLNQFTSAFTGGYELTDIKSAFQSNDLEGAYQNGSNTISTDESKYTLPDGSTPSNVGGKYTMDGVDTSIQNTGYKIDGASVPGTVGGNANDPQDGTSSKPDVAESIRQVRMARTEGSPRGFNGADFSGAEPDDSSLVSPMYKNAKRNKIRSTFLDHEGSSVQAIAAANAVAGYGKDSDGRARVNYGGKLYNFKDGMEHKGRNALMMGRPEDAMQYLDMPDVGTQPDTPAASELTPAPASTVKPGTIQMPENTGGSIEAPEPILKVDPAKQKEAEDFLNNNISMLTRRTK